jgi:hypothetical protein
MPTRIENLGELYDKAVAEIGELLGQPTNEATAHIDDYRHGWCMQVIQTYLDQTKRPEPSEADSEILRIMERMAAQTDRMVEMLATEIANDA